MFVQLKDLDIFFFRKPTQKPLTGLFIFNLNPFLQEFPEQYILNNGITVL